MSLVLTVFGTNFNISLLLLNLTISHVKLKEPEYTIIYIGFSFRNHISIYARFETPRDIQLQFSKSSSCNIQIYERLDNHVDAHAHELFTFPCSLKAITLYDQYIFNSRSRT